MRRQRLLWLITVSLPLLLLAVAEGALFTDELAPCTVESTLPLAETAVESTVLVAESATSIAVARSTPAKSS